MISRRDILTGGAFGTAFGGVEAAAQSDAQTLAELQRIRRQLEGVTGELQKANAGCFTGACEAVTKVRDGLTLHLRAAQKFPDYIEVASDVYLDLYDWHVRNQQPISVGRLADGRYTLLFMFTSVLLRPDATAGFVGVPYDAR